MLPSAQDSPLKKGGPGPKGRQCRGDQVSSTLASSLVLRRQHHPQIHGQGGRGSSEMLSHSPEVTQVLGWTVWSECKARGPPWTLCSLSPPCRSQAVAPSKPRLGTPGRGPAQEPGVRLECGPRLSLWQASPVSALVSPVIYSANTSWAASGSGGA